MTFDEILARITELLKRQGRISYGALKRRYDLDDAYLEDLKDEIIHAQRLAVDEDNRVLVWVGEQASASAPPPSLEPQRSPLLQLQTKHANHCPTRPNTLPRRF